MQLSVIISTYNSPQWLEKVLAGYCVQTFKDFELIIADDGSGEETRQLIHSFSDKLSIRHIWQDDLGFRKCRILNMAVEASQADYLVFSDGDCIPRKDFLLTHFIRRKKGHFLSGGYFKLPMHICDTITLQDIERQSCFDLQRLKAWGLKRSFKNNKLSPSRLKTELLNKITTTKATWNGHNVSGWKKDIVAVNGFNENMGYGGEDRELGERLANYGIKGVQVRYSAICVHLEHDREYIDREALQRNVLIRKRTRQQKLIWTDAGIRKEQVIHVGPLPMFPFGQKKHRGVFHPAKS